MGAGLSLLLFFTVAAAQPWRQSDYIAQAFLTIALGREYQQASDYLVKWQQPVRVFIRHQVKYVVLHDTLVAAQLSHLASITGLTIHQVASIDEANVVITFTEQAQWQSLVADELGADSAAHLHGSVCLANIVEHGGHIEFARVYIPVDLARFHGKLVACVVEELTQILGLPNDSDRVFPSIFNDKSPEVLLTGLDYLLLKLLYQPVLIAGSQYQALQAPLATILWQWQQDGTIASASQTVRQGTLYRLLGYSP
ncbi:DUF2927 domain-containing protein [Shewanella sp. NIFS-20-20]|nr:DUF2927 domain-containing protein [Shewanella sp. NIFS-20-20]